MHILIFLDQHPLSLGGAQSSVCLQKKYLELRGHRVTLCSPGRIGTPQQADIITTPSFPMTLDRSYSLGFVGERSLRQIQTKLKDLPPVDIVHIQADFWAGLLGKAISQIYDVPFLITHHTNLVVGLAATTPIPRSIARLLEHIHRKQFPLESGAPGIPEPAYRYLSLLGNGASARITPSHHFANSLIRAGFSQRPLVLPTGIDDDLVNWLRKASAPKTSMQPLRILWAGRFSPEKRLLTFLDAVTQTGLACEISLCGDGAEMRTARTFIRKHGSPHQSVIFRGHLSQQKLFSEIAASDLVVHSSMGFETQGLIVTEAIALGTPVVLCDPNVASELPEGTYQLASGHEAPSLAIALSALMQNPRRRETAAQACSAQQQFRQSKLSEKAEEIYLEALSPRPTL
ncbi:glycosyltransferase family 4 protein [Arthrobacter sp. MA-N2]|uniref:glycosyltransferase family 4 protein n=1 Tax=Arthrobacter sp. MA-N2 TaxID=1101188 RepID=UPI000485F50F